MGFFSWECEVCSRSLLSPYAINDRNAWLSDVVVITKGGSIIKGTYDGYGRVEDESGAIIEIVNAQPQVFHNYCWESENRPTFYQGESPSASDQGYFFDDYDTKYNVGRPDDG